MRIFTYVKFHANGCNIFVLHFADHRIIEMLGLVGPKVWPVSNCTQQVPTGANIVVVPCKWMQHVTTLLGQQCCVRLHGPLEFKTWEFSKKLKSLITENVVKGEGLKQSISKIMIQVSYIFEVCFIKCLGIFLIRIILISPSSKICVNECNLWQWNKSSL